MDVKPLFSVIVPTLNEEKFLPRLLDSLVGQTTKDFEVIVSDGNSKDRTVARALGYKKRLPRLKIVRNAIPGLAMQRNRGARFAKGTWFVFIDADGVLVPHALQRIKAFIQKRKAHHITPLFLPDSKTWQDAVLAHLINFALVGARSIGRPFATGQCSLMTKAMFERVGGYNEHLSWGEDNDISRRIYEQGYPIRILKEPLVFYSLRRFHREGVLRTLMTSVKAALLLILTKKTPSSVSGYSMGGQLYE